MERGSGSQPADDNVKKFEKIFKNIKPIVSRTCLYSKSEKTELGKEVMRRKRQRRITIRRWSLMRDRRSLGWFLALLKKERDEMEISRTKRRACYEAIRKKILAGK